MTVHDGAVPNQPKTPSRNVRVPDALWHDAQEVAKERGETVAEVIREALAEYVEKHKTDK